jgi:capsular polysaccharide transport system permease protein
MASIWTILSSVKIQIRVIYALTLRELNTRYGRENIGFLWIIGEPILFCGGVAIAWTAMRPSYEHGLPMTAIVITGYVPLTMWRHAIGRSNKAFEANGSLLFHRQVTPLDIITARVTLEMMGTIAAGFLVVMGAVLTGFMDPPVDLGLVYLGLFFQCAFSFACAMLIASLSEVSDILEKALAIISYLSLPFSGAFTMVDWVPKSFQHILLWSPSVHNVEMIRAGQFGPGAHATYDVFFDTWITGVLLIIGLSLTLRVRRYLVIQ